MNNYVKVFGCSRINLRVLICNYCPYKCLIKSTSQNDVVYYLFHIFLLYHLPLNNKLIKQKLMKNS